MDELFSLSTTTLVVSSPSNTPPPTMQRMLEDLHLNYRSAVEQPATAPFADIRSSTFEQQPVHPADWRRLERISDYSDALDDIVTGAGATVDDRGISVDERKLTPAQADTITKAWELALQIRSTYRRRCGSKMAMSSPSCSRTGRARRRSRFSPSTETWSDSA